MKYMKIILVAALLLLFGCSKETVKGFKVASEDSNSFKYEYNVEEKYVASISLKNIENGEIKEYGPGIEVKLGSVGNQKVFVDSKKLTTRTEKDGSKDNDYSVDLEYPGADSTATFVCNKDIKDIKVDEEVLIGIVGNGITSTDVSGLTSGMAVYLKITKAQ